jgi:hypothetical protein
VFSKPFGQVFGAEGEWDGPCECFGMSDVNPKAVIVILVFFPCQGITKRCFLFQYFPF